MNNDPPPELNDEAAVKAVKGVYRGGLDALKRRSRRAAEPAGHRHEGATAADVVIDGGDAGKHRRLRSPTAEPASVSEAFVTNQTGNSLTVVSLGDMKPVAEIAIGGKPAGIAMSADGKFAYLDLSGKQGAGGRRCGGAPGRRAVQGRRGATRHRRASDQRARLRRRLVHAQDLRRRPRRPARSSPRLPSVIARRASP